MAGDLPTDRPKNSLHVAAKLITSTLCVVGVGRGSPSGDSPNGAELERAKWAETGSKLGSSLGGAPPGELGQ